MDRRKTKRTVAILLIFLLLLLLLSLILGRKSMMNQKDNNLTASTNTNNTPPLTAVNTTLSSPADNNNTTPAAVTVEPPKDLPNTTTPPPVVENIAPSTTAVVQQTTNQNPAPPCTSCNPPPITHKTLTAAVKTPAPVTTTAKKTAHATPIPKTDPKPVNDLALEKNSLSPMRAPSKAELAFTPASKKWYIEFEVTRSTLNLPTYFLPLTIGSWDAFDMVPPPTTKARGLTLNNAVWVPEIKVGYNLDGLSIFPTCFKPSIELSYTQFYSSKSVTTHFSGTQGVAWKIDQTDAPLYNLGSKNILKTDVNGSVRYQSGSLDFKVKMSRNPTKYMCTPSVGIVYTALNQRYGYTIESSTLNLEAPVFTSGNSRLLSQYLGIALGDRFNLNFTPWISWIIDGKVHLLHARTSLVSNQIPDSEVNPTGPFSNFQNNVRITSYDNRITYRALLSTGINFYFTGVDDPNSVQLALLLGIDQWGFVPQSVTLTSIDGREPHIAARSMRDYFVSIGLIVPIA